MTLGVRKMKLLGVAAVALLAMGASGCSSLPTVPDWVDPTTWFGGSEEPADNGQTPDLASVPDKPAAPAADEQHQVAESLAGARDNAKYSADALRGGTEPAAAPPPDLAPEKVAEAPAAKPKAPVAAPAPVQTAAVDRSLAQDPSGNTAAGTLPPPPAGTPVIAAPETTAAPEPVKTAELPAPPAPPPAPAKPAKKIKAKPVQMAEAAPPPPRVAPAPEPQAVPQAPVGSISPSDADLGFKPSSAPPLDPSVSQFVSAPIVNHYEATASRAGMRSSAYASATPRHKAARRSKSTGVAMGGPANMEGKVVANLDSLGSAPAVQPPVAANPNGASAVVFFPGDAVSLNAAAKLQVRAAAEQFKMAGEQGYVRVVGHSSSRTPNMSAEKHLELIFKKSQARANAVARELIRAGVPADKVLVEAVGDTQPVFYESMPKGEDGNRRAEIFLQG